MTVIKLKILDLAHSEKKLLGVYTQTPSNQHTIANNAQPYYYW